MDARHAEVSSVFDAAVRLPIDERELYIRQRCAGAPDLIEAVLRLLAHDVDDDAFIAPPDVAREIAQRVLERESSVPDVIDGYTVLDVIGHGGGGVVYRAREQGLDRDVALKVLHAGGASDAMCRRLTSEASILASLEHAGIAKVYASGVYDSRYGEHAYLAMELVRGKTITRYCDDDSLDVAGRLRLIGDVCDAIHHAHQHAVIHRDIKPGNVLVTSAGVVKVVDFGIAKLAEDNECAEGRAGVGTLGYMSPEQVSGGWGTVDLRADVYALGVLAYRLLAGRLPLEGDNGHVPSVTAVPQIGAVVPGELGVSKDLEAVIAKAISPDKRERYGSAMDFASDLERGIRGDQVTARTPTRWEASLRQLRKHPLYVVCTLAALALMLVQRAGINDLEYERGRRANLAATRQRMVSDPIDAPTGFIPANAPIAQKLMHADHFVWRLRGDRELIAEYLLLCAKELSGLAENTYHRQRALELRREALEVLRELHGASAPDVIRAEGMMLAQLISMRRVGEAQRLLSRLDQTVLEPDDLERPPFLVLERARLLRVLGDVDGARRVLREGVGRVPTHGEVDQVKLPLLEHLADMEPPEDALATFKRIRLLEGRDVRVFKGSARLKRHLRVEQMEALAQLRAAAAQGDSEALNSARQRLEEGHARRRAAFGPASRFAQWSGYAHARGLAACGRWDELLSHVDEQIKIASSSIAEGEFLWVLLNIARSDALRETGDLAGAVEHADVIACSMTFMEPEDAEVRAHFARLTAQNDAAQRPVEERRAVLDEAWQAIAPLLVPDDERVRQLLPR